MEQDVKIYAAPLQGFTEAAWRNAHEVVFGGIDSYYTPFVRLEKGEVRNKDRREVSCERNRVSHLVPQVIASCPEELAALVDFLMGQGYKEIDINMGCPFPLMANRGEVRAFCRIRNGWRLCLKVYGLILTGRFR